MCHIQFWCSQKKERNAKLLVLSEVHRIVLPIRYFFFFFFFSKCIVTLCNQIKHEIPFGPRSFWGIIFICWNCDWPRKGAALSLYCRHPTGICFRPSEVFSHSMEKFPLDSLLPTTDLLIRDVLISGLSLFQLYSLHHLVMFMIRLEEIIRSLLFVLHVFS